MKGIELPVHEVIKIMIVVLVLAVIIFFFFTFSNASSGVDAFKERSIAQAKEKQLSDLEKYYSAFMETGGGVDSYEASVLLAKAIEYTWSDCVKFCQKTQDISDFTNFFAAHPISLKALDCDNEYEYKNADSEHRIYKRKIANLCRNADLFGEGSLKTVKTGDSLSLPSGYSLKLTSLEKDKKNALIEIFKDGSNAGEARFSGNLEEGAMFYAGNNEIIVKEIKSDSIKISATGEPEGTKKKQADEWTTTIWGLLKNSAMCTNYKADGEQWGNMYCGGVETTNVKCTPDCGTGKDLSNEITQDRIKYWDGIIEEGNTYSDIKITYDPDCTWVKGLLEKIPGASLFVTAKQACVAVQIGKGEEANKIKIYGSANACYYGTACPQAKNINPPYEDQCPAWFSYTDNKGMSVCVYGQKCCGSENYCRLKISGKEQAMQKPCASANCWYKSQEVCASGKRCGASGCA